ncbi:MAG: EAL domain-containing protein [gamma proteobacterium endosymbiont of Lamellibrachia anaximandri]|nr:EAL domain-containing protein [gamma proteobacterium endosymbiont of Lamellibrachia anaximandri]MBL3532292.1 EAL domain-containing protein [gamma proteobacterium endosymbiont of Lamellibrachia anaximandri]
MTVTGNIYAAVLAAFFVGALFFYTDSQTSRLLQLHSTVYDTIGDIERLEEQLDLHLLKASFFIYYNFDHSHSQLRKIRKRIAEIRENAYLQDPVFAETLAGFGQYEVKLAEKEELILRFATINSLIQNSTTHIPSLTARYLNLFEQSDGQYFNELSRITSAVFLASRSLDKDFLTELRQGVDKLQEYHFDDDAQARFNQVFLSHAKIFLKYLGLYSDTLQAALEVDTRATLHQAKHLFLGMSLNKADQINRISTLLGFGFILSIFVIIFLLVGTDREHKKLIALHRKLEASAATDTLTQLPNRFAFEATQKKPTDQPTLIMLNIDGFKHINDFYGTAGGDEILIQLSRQLKTLLHTRPDSHLFRFGADDFGVLISTHETLEDPLKLAQDLINFVERNSFDIHGHEVQISIRAGVASAPPLLERANMALQQTKKQRNKALRYDASLGIEEKVATNQRITRLLKNAVRRNAVKPFFQPLYNNVSKRVEHYECLMRIQDEEGQLLTPFAFMQVAKESRIYSALSRIMLEKCLDRFQSSHYTFSVNLAVEDILDPEIREYLFDRLSSDPDLGKRMTIELLESEEVADYDALKSFLSQARSHGCHLAIDDFGAGYSSFKHILELEVDQLKIDASLIRHLDSDREAQLLVKAIVDVAREIGIKNTVAEFVHSRAVFERVNDLGVDFAQGYFIGKPADDLLADERPVFAVEVS